MDELTNIAIFINYCSNERAFIRPLLKQALEITSLPNSIYVAIGSHKYRTYEPEDTEHIRALAAKFAGVHFVIYEVSPGMEKQNPLKHRPAAYWHNVGRIAAWRKYAEYRDREAGWILFLDADEIPEAAKFRKWFRSQMLYRDVAYQFANYWYFREPTLRATTLEYSPIMVHSSRLGEAALMRDMERHGIIDGMPKVVIAAPMFHHFSWVRTEADMIRKVTSWGHSDDRADWVAKVREEFARPFSGTDFVHGYSYISVPNIFNINLDAPYGALETCNNDQAHAL